MEHLAVIVKVKIKTSPNTNSYWHERTGFITKIMKNNFDPYGVRFHNGDFGIFSKDEFEFEEAFIPDYF